MDTNHDAFVFWRLNQVIWPTRCRLAEMIGSLDLACFTFESLSWSMRETAATEPTEAQLLSMRAGSDFARLTPPPSKPDQFGEVHSPSPIALMSHYRRIDAANALREVELRAKVPPRVLLFHDAQRRPHAHSKVDRMFKAAMTVCFEKAVASALQPEWPSYYVSRRRRT